MVYSECLLFWQNREHNYLIANFVTLIAAIPRPSEQTQTAQEET
ncbi:MAG TPA: hypothetical protein VK203_13965 [Nostocaceae cyanobacterium]|nr:hypothetical protein [Nostocaceae cyanobacterium]